MSRADRPISIVLDASAILRFVQGSIDVGETIREVDNDGGLVGLPVLCLAEARGLVHDHALLELLVRHPATTLVPTSDDWAGLAAEYWVVGRLDATAAVHIAIEENVGLLTAFPRLYGGMADGGPVIPVP